MEIVSCTACGRQVNHFQRDALFRHPVLKVLICKVCLCIYHYVISKTSAIQIYWTMFCDLKVDTLCSFPGSCFYLLCVNTILFYML